MSDSQKRNEAMIVSMLKLMDQYSNQREYCTIGRQSYLDRYRQQVNKNTPYHSLEEQRIHKRIAFNAQAAMITPSTKIEAQVVNISSSGLYLIGPEAPFLIGDTIRLKVWPENHYQQGPALKSVATLVRTCPDELDHQEDGHWGYGLRFDTLL